MTRAFTTLAFALVLAPLAVGCAADIDDEPLDEEIGETVGDEASALNSFGGNCADPAMIRSGSTVYMTCTGGGPNGGTFAIYSSPAEGAASLVKWTFVGEIFPKGKKPTWMQGNPWAPEIHHGKNGFVAVFGGLNGGRNVIGVATAPTIAGPWTDKGNPLVARATSSIDAHILHDGDDLFLYFKRELQDTKDADKDGNKTEGRDAIYVARLSADGKTVTSGDKLLMVADRGWEHGVVEGPWVEKKGAYYYLFYSGGYYCNNTYALGVARSKAPTGPFVKYGKPIVSSGKRFVGPGHNTVVNARGKEALVFHAYDTKEGVPTCEKNAPKDNNERGVLSFALEYKNGWPRAKGMKL